MREEAQLAGLYEPLLTHLRTLSGIASKLTFNVKRKADVKSWAKAGEALLDLRKNGPFKGLGTLVHFAVTELQPSWEAGTATQVMQAMQNFRDKHEAATLAHDTAKKTDKVAYRQWPAISQTGYMVLAI